MNNNGYVTDPAHFLLKLPAGERFKIDNGESLAIVRNGNYAEEADIE